MISPPAGGTGYASFPERVRAAVLNQHCRSSRIAGAIRTRNRLSPERRDDVAGEKLQTVQPTIWVVPIVGHED
jgi:hypothetical protein